MSKYGYQDYTIHRIFFIDSEEDSSVQHANVEQNSVRLTGVDKGSKKKGIQNDNHEQVNKLSLSKTIKQEPEDDELTIDQTKRGRRRSTVRAAHRDDESKAEGSQEINKTKSMESSPKRKRIITRKCAGVDSKPVNNYHEEKTEKEARYFSLHLQELSALLLHEEIPLSNAGAGGDCSFGRDGVPHRKGERPDGWRSGR
uniref:Uncharacterized protein n=1 Tax=Aegilops tauschii TaxID=37682 RepID=M8CY91_AEGTA